MTTYPLNIQDFLAQQEQYIEFATVGRPHGIKGAFFLKTPDRRTQWDNYPTVVIETATDFTEQKVVKAYLSGNALALQLEDIRTRNKAETLYGKRLFVHKDYISAQQDEHPVHTIVGFAVFAGEKGEIGHVVNIVCFGAQDNLEIKLAGSKETAFFPFLEKFVLKVDEQNKRLDIVYIPEFFEGSTPHDERAKDSF